MGGGGGYDELLGARIRRVDGPARGRLAVTLGGAERREVLVAHTAPEGRGVALCPERPRGDPATSFVRKLRKELAGGKVAAVVSRPGVFGLCVRRGDGARTLILELDGRGNAILLDEGDRILAAASATALTARGLAAKRVWEPPTDATFEPPGSVAALRRAAGELRAEGDAGDLERQRRSLDRTLGRALRRLERKVTAIEGDAARASRAPGLRADANALLARLHAIDPDAREATVTDWSADPPEERTVSIDPRLGPGAQAEAWFHRARRLERGAEMAAERLEATALEGERLRGLRERVRHATDREALVALAREARTLGVRGASAAVSGEPSPARREPRGRRPYRRFVGHGGREILVGRGAADNDALTLRVARPTDHWLHARGRTGAHVVVPLGKREDCPPELLVDAAHLAAHFSDARGEQTVDVIHTPRRYVRKGKGLAVGAVRVDREKVLALRVEPERLARLLATEDR